MFTPPGKRDRRLQIADCRCRARNWPPSGGNDERLSKVEDISVEASHRTVSVDLGSMCYRVRRAVSLLKSAGRGSIIHLSSIAGRLAYPLRAPYAAATRGSLDGQRLSPPYSGRRIFA